MTAACREHVTERDYEDDWIDGLLNDRRGGDGATG
jgi:hypothetical protein